MVQEYATAAQKKNDSDNAKISAKYIYSINLHTGHVSLLYYQQLAWELNPIHWTNKDLGFRIQAEIYYNGGHTQGWDEKINQFSMKIIRLKLNSDKICKN